MIPARKQLNIVIEQIASSSENFNDLENTVIKDYEELNEKCNNVISKIKTRKKKNKKLKTVST
jgi:hypothetical protein